MVESRCAKGVRRRRVGQIVRRDVNRLHRRDRAFLGRGDAFLQVAHLGRERRLITDRGGRASEQRRHFRAGLRETKDVVDEQQNVLVALIAEILRHRQSGERDAETRAGRLVHLAVNERDFRFAQILLIDDAGLAHFRVEIVAFTRPLAHTGENGEPAVAFRDVVDQLENDDGLADARAAERADFSAFGERADQIDDLDAGLEDGGLHVLVGQLRRLAMNRITLRESDRAAIIDRIAGDVKDPAESPLAHRDGDRAAGVVDRHAALQALGRGHGDGAHPVFAEMLLHFEGELGRVAVDLVFEFERVIDARELFGFIEIHVDDGTDDLDDVTCIHKRSDPRGELPSAREPQSSEVASADKGRNKEFPWLAEERSVTALG